MGLYRIAWIFGVFFFVIFFIFQPSSTQSCICYKLQIVIGFGGKKSQWTFQAFIFNDFGDIHVQTLPLISMCKTDGLKEGRRTKNMKSISYITLKAEIIIYVQTLYHKLFMQMGDSRLNMEWPMGDWQEISMLHKLPDKHCFKISCDTCITINMQITLVSKLCDSSP